MIQRAKAASAETPAAFNSSFSAESSCGQGAVDIVDQLANILSHHFLSDENDDCDRRQNERVLRHRLSFY
jgi:hypothetical protein